MMVWGFCFMFTNRIFFPLFSLRCFIPNAYAALFTAALVPLMCLVVVFVVFIHAYQVTPQWKAYDDIFRGRTNAAGTICWLPLRKQVWLSERYWLFFPVQKTPLETTGTPTHLSLSVSGPFDICAITLMMKVMQRLNCLRRQKSVKPKKQ